MRSVLVIPEAVEASDGRSYPPGLLTWRETVPLQFSDETTEHHEGAYHVGNITNLRRQTVDGATWIVGDLSYDTDEDASEAERLAQEGKVPGVSADVALVVEVVGVDDEGFPITDIISAEIVGVTQVPMPAFAGARILTDTEAMDILPPLVAAAVLDSWRPPRELFEVPEPDEPTPITVYDAGDFIGFYGHAAQDWNQCHLGFTDCVMPPRSPSDGGEFNTRAMTLEDGSQILVGPVTMGTDQRGGHADLNASISETTQHYDNANTVIGMGRLTNGEIAPWVCGAILPDVTPAQLTRFQLQQLSGDWRRKNGALDMYACLAVPIGGFGIKARVASGEIQAMIAAGPPPVEEPDPIQVLTEKVDSLSDKLDQYLGTDDEPEPIQGDNPPSTGYLAAVLDHSKKSA